jgi:hypothetical protein
MFTPVITCSALKSSFRAELLILMLIGAKIGTILKKYKIYTFNCVIKTFLSMCNKGFFIWDWLYLIEFGKSLSLASIKLKVLFSLMLKTKCIS